MPDVAPDPPVPAAPTVTVTPLNEEVIFFIAYPPELPPLMDCGVV